MYESPIELYISDISQQIAKQQDEQIWQAVVRCVPNVDKEELIRALQYDRKQYEKGYADGKAAAMAELVLCKECTHRENLHGQQCCPYYDDYPVEDDHFCAYGERREGE